MLNSGKPLPRCTTSDRVKKRPDQTRGPNKEVPRVPTANQWPSRHHHSRKLSAPTFVMDSIRCLNASTNFSKLRASEKEATKGMVRIRMCCLRVGSTTANTTVCPMSCMLAIFWVETCSCHFSHGSEDCVLFPLCTKC